MAIRLRQVDGVTVALCAAESDAQPTDLYLDGNAHHALMVKFEMDLHREGVIASPPNDARTVALMETQKVRDAQEECRRWNESHCDDTPIGCYDCGRQYGDGYGFPDLLVPNDIWRRISPTGDEGGLLCPSCIVKRVAAIGCYSIPAAFMSGPLKSVDPTVMEALLGMENLREQLLPHGAVGS